jgi:hypothetical protein
MKKKLRLNGCYAHLDGGLLSEALQDFTGGICETIPIGKPRLAFKKFESIYSIRLCFVIRKKGKVNQRQARQLV